MNLLMNWIQREKYINTLTWQDAEEKIGKLNGKEFGRGRWNTENRGDWEIFTENRGYLKIFTENRGYLKIFT